MMDIRKIIVVFLVGILFAVFVQSFAEAIYPSPVYDKYCKIAPREIQPPTKTLDCPQVKSPECGIDAIVEWNYDSEGCPYSAECNYCHRDLREARDQYNLIVFIVSSIFGLVAIILGLYMPSKGHALHEWVATGFMLGGLISIFVGTIRYYESMGRFLRPAVLLVELVLVIYLAYKKLKK